MTLKITQRRIGEIPLDQIDFSENNVRKEDLVKNIEELKTSIKEVGLIHPIVIVQKPDKRYELIVGQRRYIAFQQLSQTSDKFKTIPAIIILDKLDDVAKKIISFTENAHRRDLPYSDTIAICDELFSMEKGPDNKKIETVAKRVGISPQTISKYLSYRLVPKKVQGMVEEGKLTRSQAYKITTAFWPNTEKIEKIAEYTTKVPRPSWEKALDFGRTNKSASVEEIIEQASKSPAKIKLTVSLSEETLGLLKTKMEEMSKALKRDISLEEYVLELIDKALSED